MRFQILYSCVITLFIHVYSYGQIDTFQYHDNLPLTEFMSHCLIAEDSEERDNGVPLIGADYVPAIDIDFNTLGKKYWMKFIIKNNEDFRVSIQMFLGLSEVLNFYLPVEGGFEKFPIGAFESREIVKKIRGSGKTFLSQALVSLDPRESKTFYAYFNHLSGGMQAKRDAQIAPRLIDGELWHAQNTKSNIIWSFVFGCFIILILYHIVYYFLTRDLVYLYYCFFVFVVSFPFLTLLVDIGNNPEFNEMLFFTVSGLVAVFYFQLTRKLIPIKVLLPKWDKILRYYIWTKVIIVLVYTMLHIVTKDIFVILSMYIPAILVEIVLMIMLAIALLRTKDRIALLFVLGSLIAWLVLFIAVLNADPASSFTPQIKPFKFATPAYGFVLESLFFAMVLSIRAKLNEQDKRKAQTGLIRQLQENKELQDKVNRELEAKVVERTKRIELEKQKSEKILLNILPIAIVQEMKDTGTIVPRHYENVTVLFADFVGFTKISELLTPEKLVEHLDRFFKEFDSIIAKFGLEKIKTIGDAYMCAAGVPNPRTNHQQRTIMAAIELQEYLAAYNQNIENIKYKWELRIGIQSGPVVAGVIGEHKFSYDIWGDTVNTAARLESHSVGGKINISEDVYLEVKDQFVCNKRGTFDVKNKGDITMYFVEGLKSGTAKFSD